ncbi:hypothetical protein GGS21DRAFT_526327 [Xylaria nigripes]|nr:hypothetical protein GGS21DRAFT_526327 [Xylaria nigripes]
MGVLKFYSGAYEGASRPAIRFQRQLDRKSTTPAAMQPWMIVLIVVATLAVIALIVFLLVHCIKSRRRQAEGFQPVGQMSSRHLRSGRVSTDDRRKAEDLERDMIIRKSLATRPSSAVTYASRQKSAKPHRNDHSEEEESEEQGDTTSLKEDWKAWEARIQSERRLSTPRGLSLNQHPAFQAPEAPRML